jgi:hypothetical protein
MTDYPEDLDPAVMAARAAVLTGIADEMLIIRRWAHAIATGDEDLERLAAPYDESPYWLIARTAVAEVVVLLGSLAEGDDLGEYLAQLIAVQTIANDGG